MPVHPDTPNLFGLTQYDGATSFFDGAASLNQATGYAIVVGFGAFFTIFTTILVFLDYRYGGTKQTSEQFNCGGRSIKQGLIAVDIVSHWTWAATLLQSSNVAYKNGISGPFWYAAGATVQILLFGILAIEIKRKAPTAHTVLEIVNARWGRAAHLTFFVFCIMTNILVTAMLLLGGAAVINALTGMSIYAAAFLIPIGIILYTVAGGLKATFLSSYIHTVIIYVVLCLFAFLVYTPSHVEQLGSPAKVWNNLHKMAEQFPVEGNMGGSYLTMFSKGGFIFGIINIIGNFGTVFVDQARGYWQSAIAAKPSAAHTGYLMGGLMWFCIPFTLATTMGLGALALDLPITVAEAGEGLVPPATAVFLMGKAGSILIVTMLFMAVTSAGSAELVAVSSLCTYDIYRTYINPKATGNAIMRISQVIICAFGIFMGVLAIVLLEINVSLGYVYLLMGVLIGSAVIPIAYCLVWSKCTATAAITGAVSGICLAIMSWLISAKTLEGELTLYSTGQDYPMLIGNLVAIFSSGIICTVMSLIKPDAYDWQTTREIPMVDDTETGFTEDGPDSHAAMEHAYKWILKWGGGTAFILIVAWPCLTLPAKVFSQGYFTFWVILSIVWGLIATFLATFLPLWESRAVLIAVLSALVSCKRADPKDMEEFGKFAGKPGVPRVPGGNPFVTPDTTVHNPKEGDVELGKATTETTKP
ncbi:urea active transporter-like protein [Coccomyxa subellipsoidea C-169]|uniref:Urea-proton symporter DUR3 n=1 Tax=Coccomyxa subellipsoidea (strain C-169) TaxID=574566 RepID=I0YQ78_COCSC|nr:urea active transporter-like protein [Coccomyxa subellipsoidea C-169]EIE20547.1 urea active transporter-like protein [Coccomyxa subellipsoidea C-169]|eukprot:XP_005645091.1 urea active transporter-like protein [Coccomyxa subellipsoidea C-169]